MKPCSYKKRYQYTLLGMFFLTIGVGMALLKSHFLAAVLPSLLLEPGTFIGEFWRKPPIQLVGHIYFLNWTNPEDLHNSSTKPKFEDVGPYIFLGSTEKTNITWNDNGTVSYFMKERWDFDTEHPMANLSDNVVTLNVITACMSHVLRYWNIFAKLLISSAISAASPNVHVTRTAEQLLVEGYDDFYGDLAQFIGPFLPNLPMLNKLGIVSTKNITQIFERAYNTENGARGSYEVRNWNYNNRTPFYERPCADVHGSTGELHVIKSPRETLDVFCGMLCRHLPFEYEEDVVVDGILGYKYIIGDRVLDNGTLYPENKCYCPGECMPSGVINVSECFFGIAGFMSLPHFYGADPYYLNSMEGLKPEKEKHETYIVVEPTTGMPLKAVVRVQPVILIQPIEGMGVFENVPKIYFPLLWGELFTTIPDELLAVVKMFLGLPTIYNAITLVFLILGAGILFSGVAFKVHERLCTSGLSSVELEEHPLQSEEEEKHLCGANS